MTCTQMPELLLEADPDELRGRGDSAVAEHLRQCDRCRALAEHVLSDTRALGIVVERGAAIPRIRRSLVVPVLASAAALAFMLMPDGSRAPVQIAPPVAVAPPAPVVVTPTQVPVTAGGRPPAQRRNPTMPVATARTRAVSAIPRSVAGFVDVTPPPGRTAVVLRTNDPAITLVWLH